MFLIITSRRQRKGVWGMRLPSHHHSGWSCLDTTPHCKVKDGSTQITNHSKAGTEWSTSSHIIGHYSPSSLIKQHFWRRWHREYLNERNIRNKWSKGSHDIREGTVVVLREDNVPSMQWPLGRVIKVHPGVDFLWVATIVCVERSFILSLIQFCYVYFTSLS